MRYRKTEQQRRPGHRLAVHDPLDRHDPDGAGRKQQRRAEMTDMNANLRTPDQLSTRNDIVAITAISLFMSWSVAIK